MIMYGDKAGVGGGVLDQEGDDPPGSTLYSRKGRWDGTMINT